MMKRFEANDTTFIILFRADSIARLENLIEVIKYLDKIFKTTIYVREADTWNNGIVRAMCGDIIKYEFVEDFNPILHKTKHFNEMLKRVTTEFVGIVDADVIAHSQSICECVEKLRNGEAKMALPYNGVCLDTSEIIRCLYLQRNDISILDRNMQKMERLQSHILTGGAVIMHTETFTNIGGENEVYYGWGDDDFDRYIRFLNRGYSIFRSNSVLFHLSHPRGDNSGFSSALHQRISKGELFKTQHQV